MHSQGTSISTEYIEFIDRYLVVYVGFGHMYLLIGLLITYIFIPRLLTVLIVHITGYQPLGDSGVDGNFMDLALVTPTAPAGKTLPRIEKGR